MVKIRLKRLGYKKNPVYRIVVIDSREKREGRPIEELGFYNPKTKEMKLDKANAQNWLSKGAQASETVAYLIANCDENGALIYKKKEVVKLSKKAQEKAKAEQEAQAAAQAAAAEEAAAATEAEASV
ncbi:MAG: 30S ribosomal protein S16 [Cyanobacteria bacterium SIG30]|nr:30S ribosomal protein S16 [Cyanobacteria bacterium SIG30]